MIPLTAEEQVTVEAQLPSVHLVANIMRERLRGRWSYDDLYQEAAIGAIEAVRTYKPGSGRTLKSWVEWVAERRVVDVVRRESGSRSVAVTERGGHGGRVRIGRFRALHEMVYVDGLERFEIGDPDTPEQITALVALDQALERVPNEGDRVVAAEHLRHGLTLAEIGERHGYTESRACQRFRRACRVLERQLA